MKEERMTILKMIESGKITADEGVKLLNSLKGNDVLSNVKDRVTKFAKVAEPRVRAAAEKVADKSMVIGNNVKKKVEEKVAKSKYKDQIYEAKDKVTDVIDDVVDDVKEIFEDDLTEDTPKPEETVDTQSDNQ